MRLTIIAVAFAAALGILLLAQKERPSRVEIESAQPAPSAPVRAGPSRRIEATAEQAPSTARAKPASAPARVERVVTPMMITLPNGNLRVTPKKMIEAVAELGFTVQEVEALDRLWRSIQPAIPEDDPDFAPRESIAPPAQIRRQAAAILGDAGLAKLHDAARVDVIPPPISGNKNADTCTLIYHAITHPLGGWWPYLKDGP